MTCRELTSFIADYLSGELPVDVRSAFERHLSRCRNCVQYVADYNKTVALGRLALDDDAEALPPDVPEGLVTAILEARRGSKPE